MSTFLTLVYREQPVVARIYYYINNIIYIILIYLPEYDKATASARLHIWYAILANTSILS